MKKIFAFLIPALLFVSCYEEYVKDYDYDGIYFPNPVNVRTVVVGEGLKIKVGAQLGGVLENTRDRNVNFVIDNSLIKPAVLTAMKNHSWFWVSGPAGKVEELKPLPGDYYTLSDPGRIIIKKGWHSGNVTLKVDSLKFLGDEGTKNPIYAVSFYITDADADTIVENFRSAIIGIRYENKLFGNYLHGGVAVVKNAAGATVETIKYQTAVNQTTEIMQLSTVAPHALTTNGYARNRTGKPEIKLTIEGNNVIVGSAPGSTYTFEPDGESTFNGSKLLQDRKIFLKYKYVENNLTYYCQDTLTFRNRIRDGINEWQDENPENYK